MGRTKTIDDDELLRVARRVFREQGHTASTRDVARAAGISQAVLYQRFGSKEDLFLRAMTPEPPDLEELLGPYPPRSARADLKRICERLTDFFVSSMPTLLHVIAHPDLGGTQLKEWHDRLPFRPIVEGLTIRLKRMRDDGLIGAINPMAAAQSMLSTVHTVALLETMFGGHPAGDRGKHLDAMVDVMWSGFAPRDD